MDCGSDGYGFESRRPPQLPDQPSGRRRHQRAASGTDFEGRACTVPVNVVVVATTWREQAGRDGLSSGPQYLGHVVEPSALGRSLDGPSRTPRSRRADMGADVVVESNELSGPAGEVD